MTKYYRRPTRGFIAAVLTLDGSPIVITKVWFGDAIYVSTISTSYRFWLN